MDSTLLVSYQSLSQEDEVIMMKIRVGLTAVSIAIIIVISVVGCAPGPTSPSVKSPKPQITLFEPRVTSSIAELSWSRLVAQGDKGVNFKNEDVRYDVIRATSSDFINNVKTLAADLTEPKYTDADVQGKDTGFYYKVVARKTPWSDDASETLESNIVFAWPWTVYNASQGRLGNDAINDVKIIADSSGARVYVIATQGGGISLTGTSGSQITGWRIYSSNVPERQGLFPSAFANVTSVAIDRNSDPDEVILWMAADGGLYRVGLDSLDKTFISGIKDKKNGWKSFARLQNPTLGIDQDATQLKKVVVDSFGSVWAVSNDDNIFEIKIPTLGDFLNSNNIEVASKHTIAGNPAINNFEVDLRGVGWAAVAGGIATNFTQGTTTWTILSQDTTDADGAPLEGLLGASAITLALEPAGFLWVGSTDGISSVDTKASNLNDKGQWVDFTALPKEQAKSRDDQLRALGAGAGPNVNAIHPVINDDGSVGKVWFGLAAAFGNNNILALVYDKNINSWVGYSSTDGIPAGSVISSIAVDSIDGSAWIGTNQGLVVFASTVIN